MNYIEKPIAFTLFFMAILIGGTLAFLELPIKMYPDMVKPGFRINFGDSDIGLPEQMRKQYGRAIDEQLSKLKGLEKYSVTYYPTWNLINLNFQWDSDEEKLKSDIENVFIPLKEAKRGKFWFNINSDSSRSSGRFIISVGHRSLSGIQLRDYLDQTLTRELKKNTQIENIEFWGWQQENLFLEINHDKLLEHNLTLDDVSETIRSGTNHIMAGKLIEGEMDGKKNIQIDIPPNIKDITHILELPLFRKDGQTTSVKIRHIAELKEEFAKSNSIFKLNQDQATFMAINLKSKGDMKKTCDHVISKVDAFAKNNSDLTYDVIVNPAKFVENSMINLLMNALIGGIVSVLVVYLFLGSLPNTFIIALSIPFCLVASFLLMKLFDISINIISLGGMAIGVGMILDSSIVVLENIWRKKSLQNATLNSTEKTKLIIDSLKEVALPIVMSVLTSIVVFMPILFTASYTKAILGDLAKMVIFTLVLSLPAALIVVPVLSHKIMPEEIKPKGFLKIWDKLAEFYERSLNTLLATKKRMLTFVVLSMSLFLLSLFLFPLIKKEIVAIPATKLIAIRIDLPDNQDLSFTEKKVLEVENYLKHLPEMKTIATAVWNPDNGYIIGVLEHRKHFIKVRDEFNKVFKRSPTSNIHAHKWDPGKMPLPDKKDMVISISGDSTDNIAEASKIITEIIPNEKFSFQQRPWKDESENIQITFHPWTSSLLKSSSHKILQTATKTGLYIDEFFSEGKSIPLSLRFLKQHRTQYIEDMRNLPIPYENKFVALKSLAQIEFNTSQVKPVRFEDEQRNYNIKLWSHSKDDTEKSEQISNLKSKVKAINLPKDVNITYPNPNLEMDKSINSFQYSLLISIFLVFLVIALMFNSLRYPLVILSSIPLAIIGVSIGLYLWDSTLSLNSMLGTILLCGLVVNNAIILIDFYIKEDKSLAPIERIKSAAKLRLRPILMSTLTTLLGVFPIALGLGEGGEVLAPLGVSIFSGLTLSTLFCLYFIPSIVLLTERKSLSTLK